MSEPGNDDLQTPPWILDLVRSMGPIALDPCSNEWSTVGALTEWSKDGLVQSWTDVAHGVGSIWLNPPYSKPLMWCQAAHASALFGCIVFALVKNDPTTRWWKLLQVHSTARCDFGRRISFVGGKHKAGQMASSLWYAGPDPHLFAHTFAPFGEVRVYR